MVVGPENLRKLPIVTQFFRSRAGSQTQTACKDIPKIVFLSFLLLMNRTSMRISHFLDSNNITPHTEKRLPAYAWCKKKVHIRALRKLSVVLRLHLRAGSGSPHTSRMGDGRNTRAWLTREGHPQT